jgi:alpha-D-ribose 1-methylphosphonate 5-triphosphate synthase subunit PhnH
MSSAVCVEAERARFALIAADAGREDQMSLIERLCGGSAQSPERGATVLLECRHLATVASENAAPFLWEVTGPGVEDCHHFASDGDAWFVARAARRDEFPCGIDFILVDRRGELLALPRTAQVRAATSPVLSVSPVSSIPTGEGV